MLQEHAVNTVLFVGDFELSGQAVHTVAAMSCMYVSAGQSLQIAEPSADL
jgi:hypothetical protein